LPLAGTAIQEIAGNHQVAVSSTPPEIAVDQVGCGEKPNQLPVVAVKIPHCDHPGDLRPLPDRRMVGVRGCSDERCENRHLEDQAGDDGSADSPRPRKRRIG
jgi:hypothetical protein